MRVVTVRAARVALPLLALAVISCGDGGAANPLGNGESKTTLAGFAGGFVAVDGAALTIPAGALRPDTSVTLTSTTVAPPAGARTWSPVYKFEPEGLMFIRPVTVEIDVHGAGTNAVIMWSRRAGGYEKLATQVTGGKARAMATHFSTGFVADGSVPFAGAM